MELTANFSEIVREVIRIVEVTIVDENKDDGIETVFKITEKVREFRDELMDEPIYTWSIEPPQFLLDELRMTAQEFKSLIESEIEDETIETSIGEPEEGQDNDEELTDG